MDAERPFITCKAGSTKNKKDARQYINSDLADELQDLVETKNPGMPMFDMPAEWDQAAMLRADLANARHEWLRVAEGNQEEHARREKSDFLNEKNHDGQVLDFHSLRHTCGAWLAMTGAHPKAVQVVMWHSSITLTMDTYGHLFPGQEAETIARLPEMFGIGMNATDTMLSREGTAMPSAGRAVNVQETKGGDRRELALLGLIQEETLRPEDERKVLPDVILDKARPRLAGTGEDRPGRDRTYDQGIMRTIKKFFPIHLHTTDLRP